MNTSAPVYRPILKKAFATAWFHRELWPLAAIAGILGTGTAVNDILAFIRNTVLSQSGSSAASTDVYVVFQGYFNLFIGGNLQYALGSFLIFFGLCLMGLVILLGSQHAILRTVHRAAAKKQKVSARVLVNEMSHMRFRRLFVLNAFFKLLTVNLLVATGFLLANLSAETVVTDAAFGFIFALFSLGVILVLNIIGVFSLIAVTRDNASTTDALEEAVETFSSHPIVSLEMSVILFGLNFCFTVLYIAVLLMSITPALSLLSSAIETGSLITVSAVSIFTLLVFFMFTIAFGGFVTAFTYSAWTELSYKIMRVKKLHPRLHLHGKRLLEHFSRAA
jgi:hypothetical protein